MSEAVLAVGIVKPLILSLLMMSMGCSSLTSTLIDLKSDMLGGAKTIPELELKHQIGHYHMTRLSMRDKESGESVDFFPGREVDVILDGHESIRYQGRIVGINLDQKKSTLHIKKGNECAFQWRFNASSRSLDAKKATLGRLKIRGDSSLGGCLLDDGTARVPGTLMPVGEVTYKMAGGTLIFSGNDEYTEQDVYFERDYSEE